MEAISRAASVLIGCSGGVGSDNRWSMGSGGGDTAIARSASSCSCSGSMDVGSARIGVNGATVAFAATTVAAHITARRGTCDVTGLGMA